MNTTPYRVFGFIAVHVRFHAGEHPVFIEPVSNSVFSVGENFPYIWFFTKGRKTYRNLSTGETIERFAGQSTLTSPIPSGEWEMSLPEDCELFCFSEIMNKDKLPMRSRLQEWHAESGQTTLAQGTKLFLTSGSLIIDGIEHTGPTQIHVKSGTKTAQATAKCCGVLIS